MQQSQSKHIEIIGEKNTLRNIIQPPAAEYGIPMTLGRGYCSLPPRLAMAERYKRSGKDRLILLASTDFDPDGEEIAHSFARSMRDDFGINAIDPIKVALTADQVAEYELPPKMAAKPTSVNYKRFVEQHGHNVFEVEAISGDQLQGLLRDAIDSVLDVEAFNHEIAQEKADAAQLQAFRNTANDVMFDLLGNSGMH